MRTFFTSLFAFILSGLAGGLVAQQLAVATNAQEEFIIVFMASALVTCVVAFVFFVAQLMNDPIAAVAKAGKWTLIVFVVLLVALIGLILYADGNAVFTNKDMPMVAGLALPNLVTIIVHWLFVRWRVRAAAKPVGNGAKA